MKAYSEDLRRKIVQAVERGISKSQAARLFGISLSSVKRYAKLASQGESLTPRKGGGEPTLRRFLKGMGFSRKKGLWGRWNGTNS